MFILCPNVTSSISSRAFGILLGRTYCALVYICIFACASQKWLFFTCAALLSNADALRRVSTVKTTPWATTKPLGKHVAAFGTARTSSTVMGKSFALRGGGCCLLEPRVFVESVCALMGIYGLQMLLLPNKIHSDHYRSPSTPDLEYWIRGQAASIGAAAFAIWNLREGLAHKVRWRNRFLLRKMSSTCTDHSNRRHVGTRWPLRG